MGFSLDNSEVKSTINVEKGCLFRDKCKFCEEIYGREKPKLKEVNENHEIAYHLF